MSFVDFIPVLMILGGVLFYVAGIFFRRPDAPQGWTIRPRGIWKDLTPVGTVLATIGLSLLGLLGFVYFAFLK